MNNGFFATLSFTSLSAKIKNKPSEELFQSQRELKASLSQFFQSFSIAPELMLGQMGEAILLDLAGLLLKASKQEELHLYATSLVWMLKSIETNCQDFLAIQSTAKQINQHIQNFETKPITAADFHVGINLIVANFIGKAKRLAEDFLEYSPPNYPLAISKLEKIMGSLTEIDKLAGLIAEQEKIIEFDEESILDLVKKMRDKVSEFSNLAKINSGDIHFETKIPIKIITAKDCVHLIMKIVNGRIGQLPKTEDTAQEVCDAVKAILSGVTPFGEAADALEILITSLSSDTAVVDNLLAFKTAHEKKDLQWYYSVLAAKIGAAATLGVLACFFPPVLAAIPLILSGTSTSSCMVNSSKYIRELILTDSGQIDHFTKLIDNFQKCIRTDNDIRIIKYSLLGDLDKAILNEHEDKRENKYKTEEKQGSTSIYQKAGAIHKKDTLQMFQSLMGGQESPVIKEIKSIKTLLDPNIYEFLTSPQEYKKTYEITQALFELKPGKVSKVLCGLFMLPTNTVEPMMKELGQILGDKVHKNIVEGFVTDICQFIEGREADLASSTHRP